MFLYGLVQFAIGRPNSSSLNVETLAHEPGSPGRVFLLDEESLLERLAAIEELSGGQVTWSETAGLRQIFFKVDPKTINIKSLMAGAYRKRRRLCRLARTKDGSLPMSLNERVRITPRFQRAIRMDTDLGKVESLLGFQCTTTFSRVVTTICEQLGTTGHGAYTITGPFGSGKSSLLVAFASALGPRGQARELAQTALGPSVTQAIAKNMAPGRLGWRVVPVIGARSTPASLVIDALETSKLIRPREDRRKYPSEADVFDILKRLAQHPKHAGLILVIDELGKSFGISWRPRAEICSFSKT